MIFNTSSSATTLPKPLRASLSAVSGPHKSTFSDGTKKSKLLSILLAYQFGRFSISSLFAINASNELSNNASSAGAYLLSHSMRFPRISKLALCVSSIKFKAPSLIPSPVLFTSIRDCLLDSIWITSLDKSLKYKSFSFNKVSFS